MFSQRKDTESHSEIKGKKRKFETTSPTEREDLISEETNEEIVLTRKQCISNRQQLSDKEAQQIITNLKLKLEKSEELLRTFLIICVGAWNGETQDPISKKIWTTCTTKRSSETTLQVWIRTNLDGLQFLTLKKEPVKSFIQTEFAEHLKSHAESQEVRQPAAKRQKKSSEKHTQRLFQNPIVPTDAIDREIQIQEDLIAYEHEIASIEETLTYIKREHTTYKEQGDQQIAQVQFLFSQTDPLIEQLTQLTPDSDEYSETEKKWEEYTARIDTLKAEMITTAGKLEVFEKKYDSLLKEKEEQEEKLEQMKNSTKRFSC